MANHTKAVLLGEKVRETVPTVQTVPLSASVRRIDTRQMITMRDVLEWAYRREMVRFAGSGGHATPQALSGGGRSATGRVCDILDDGFMAGTGSGWMGAPSAHPDAEHLHAMVLRLERADYWRVVRAAEDDRAVPVWDPEIRPLQVRRVLKASGAPRMYVCPVRRRPVAERIEVVGVSAADAAAIRGKARAEWARWVQLLEWMRHDLLIAPKVLKRWQITGLGVEAEPWRER